MEEKLSIREIKKEARSKLAQKYPQTLISCFLFLAIIIGVDVILTSLLSLVAFNAIVGIITTIFIIVITFPLSYGLVSLFLDYSRNTPAKATDFINRAMLNFTNVCKTTSRLLLKLLKFFLIGVLASFIILMCVVIAEENIIHPTAAQREVINNVSVAIVTIGYVLGIIGFYLPYSLSYYVLADNSESAGKESLSISKNILTGNIGKFILLYLSFLPYGLVIYLAEYLLNTYTQIQEIGAIVSLVGSILLMPYVLISVATFFDNIKGNLEPKKKKRGRNKKSEKESE